MGAFWLHNVVGPLQAAFGSQFETYPGWETRSRSSGGFDQILGVLVHHTAGGTNQNTNNSAYAQWVTHAERPVANFTLGREGRVILGCAGASNHAGKGAARNTSKGHIPADSGNRYLIGIEACNNGVGEQWTKPQLDAYVKLCAVLCSVYGLNPLFDVIAHFEYAPDRKIDPAGGTGQSPYANLSDTRYWRWDMDRFRQDVNQENLMAIATKTDLVAPRRLLDTRQFGGRAVPNQILTITVPNAGGAVGALVTLTSVDSAAPGYLSASSRVTAEATFSNLNYVKQPGAVANTTVTSLTPQGTFQVLVGAGATHFLVDLNALLKP